MTPLHPYIERDGEQSDAERVIDAGARYAFPLVLPCDTVFTLLGDGAAHRRDDLV